VDGAGEGRVVGLESGGEGGVCGGISWDVGSCGDARGEKKFGIAVVQTDKLKTFTVVLNEITCWVVVRCEQLGNTIQESHIVFCVSREEQSG
jgi:hypothetical protein